MPDFVLQAGNVAQKWDSEFFSEYVRYSGFLPYMGTSANNAIVVKKELASGGRTLNIPLIGALAGNGVGAGVLENNEVVMDNFNHPVTLDWVRQGVLVAKDQEHHSEFSVRDAAKEMLMRWAKNRLRADIITALGTVDGIVYGTATAGERDAWMVRNNDRILYGAARSNLVGTNALSLANVDTTNDLLNPAAISLMKVMAKTGDNPIMPIGMKDDKGQEYFVMFTNSQNFFQLSRNAEMVQANRDARERNEQNPLFQGGDLYWDGVIIKEIPEIASLGAVGAASALVSPAYLCGAQAVAIAWGQETKSTAEVRDYGFRSGVGIEEARGVSKVLYGTVGATPGKQHGVVTGFFATTF